MLTKWTLANFKAIADKVTFNLAPITIFVGENSSGKSSVLQSILLLSQTLKAGSSRQPLVLNGEFIRLGYMADVIHEGLGHLPLEIGFELHSQTPQKNKDEIISSPIEVDFQVHTRVPDLDDREDREGVLSSFEMRRGKNDHLLLERTFPRKGTILDEEEYEKLEIPLDILGDIKLGMYDYTVKRIDVSQGVAPNPIDIYDLHTSLYHFLPNRILVPYNALRVSVIQTLKIMREFLESKHARISDLDALSFVPSINLNELKGPFGALIRREISYALEVDYSRNARPDQNEIQFTKIWMRNLESSKTLSDWLKRIKTENSTHIKRFCDRLLIRVTKLEKEIPSNEGTFITGTGVRSSELPTPLQEINSQILDYFKESVHYLGPLRAEPQFIYNLPPYPELTHVGLKGEYTASVLERFKNVVIEYPIPPNESQTNIPNSEFIKIGKATLEVALQQWLVYMGLLDRAITNEMGKMGTRLSVFSKGVSRELDLTSIGVGVSQVLPTLVAGLIAPRGITLLMEQPELHLHPRVQSMMADFFIGLAKVGKQCIVETHSEYLVSRLRRRVAEDETDTLASQSSIYFVERKNGKSSFRKLDLNQYGALLEWPEGFMDQGPNESELIMKAALKKRKQQTTNQ